MSFSQLQAVEQRAALDDVGKAVEILLSEIEYEPTLRKIIKRDGAVYLIRSDYHELKGSEIKGLVLYHVALVSLFDDEQLVDVMVLEIGHGCAVGQIHIVNIKVDEFLIGRGLAFVRLF